jgi:hypothetical protein
VERRDLVLDEAPHGVAEGLVVLVEKFALEHGW